MAKINSGAMDIIDLKVGSKELEYPIPFAERASNPFEARQFHVDYLKTCFNNIARPHAFKVQIIPPKNINWDKEILALVKSTNTPSAEVENIEYERSGHKINLPSNKMNYGNFSVTFICDSQYRIRSVFNDWQKSTILNPVAARGDSTSISIGPIPKNIFNTSVILWHFNEQKQPVYAVKMNYAWPKSISEMSLDQGSGADLMTFNVDFVYSHQEIWGTYTNE